MRISDWSSDVCSSDLPLSDTLEIQARGLVFRDQRTLRFAGADSSSEGQDASIRLISRGTWQVDALAYVQARNFSNIVISSSSFRKVPDQRNTPYTGFVGKIEMGTPVRGGPVEGVECEIGQNRRTTRLKYYQK